MSSRINAIIRLVRATYMQSEYLDVLIDGFTKQAALMGKKIKSGNALTQAKERIKSDDFIKPFAASFDKLSIEEINYLADFFSSETMKKYHKISLELAPLTQAIQEAFVTTSKDA